MIRAIGAGLVLAACSGIGFRIASEYHRRPVQLRALAGSVRLLQADVEYSVKPLPQALRHIADRTAGPLSQLYRVAADALSNVDVTVAEAFAQGIAACAPETALTSQDFDVLTELGSTLGTSDSVHQSQQIDLTLSRLAALESDARELQRRNERLWQYLGVLSGVMIVILLY